ncbi:hypothetical protein L3Q82_021610, partial [Scortum barcoo]
MEGTSFVDEHEKLKEELQKMWEVNSGATYDRSTGESGSTDF